MDANVLKALGDPHRFELLQMMADRSYCVRALARRSHLTASAVSQHLKILREAGLIYGIRIGYYTHYRVDTDALGQVIAELEAIRSAQRKPCDGPFYGCPESEYVRCKSYVPMEERDKTEDGTC